MGETAAAVEDCGGVIGYQKAVEVIADPTQPEHRSRKARAESAVGPWGSAELDDADLDGARAGLEVLFGRAGDDLSGLAAAASALAADAQIEAFAAWLEPGFRLEWRRHLRRPGAPRARAAPG